MPFPSTFPRQPLCAPARIAGRGAASSAVVLFSGATLPRSAFTFSEVLSA